MPRQSIPVIAILLGMLLIFVSYLWPESGVTTGWTEERSKEHSINAAKLHQMSYQATPDPKKKNEPPKVSQAELEAQKQKWLKGEADLEAARTGGVLWARLCWLAGIATTVGGVAAAFVIPAEHEEGKKK